MHKGRTIRKVMGGGGGQNQKICPEKNYGEKTFPGIVQKKIPSLSL